MIATPNTRRLLLDCYSKSGRPLATAFIPTNSQTGDAAERFEIRVKNCLRRMVELGADQSMIDTAEAVLNDHEHSDGTALALVVASDEVVLAHAMFRPVVELFVSLGPTPALLPLLEATQADLSHVAVLLDRTGADIWYRSDLGAAIESREVTGDDEHVHRGHPGGWSQRRFQQIAENSWEDNAKEVVAALLAESSDAELVVAGGDVRAVGFFADHLPGRVGDLIIVDGSRAEGPDPFLDNADVAVRTEAAERMVASIREMRDALGEGRAVEGRQALELLGQGRIGEIFVGDDSAAENRPSESFDFSIPLMVEPGAGTSCAVTDGAVALAVATGADVTVVPSTTVSESVVGVVRGDL